MFCTNANAFYIFCLHCSREKQIERLQTLTNSEDSSERESNIFSGFPFLFHWSILSEVQSWPAFGTIFKIAGGLRTTFRVTGGYRKAGTNFQKRVIEKIFTVSK